MIIVHIASAPMGHAAQQMQQRMASCVRRWFSCTGTLPREHFSQCHCTAWKGILCGQCSRREHGSMRVFAPPPPKQTHRLAAHKPRQAVAPTHGLLIQSFSSLTPAWLIYGPLWHGARSPYRLPGLLHVWCSWHLCWLVSWVGHVRTDFRGVAFGRTWGGGGVTLLAGHAIMLHSLHAHASGPPHGPSAGAVASARLTGRSSSSGQAARRGGWWRQRHVAQSAKGRLMQHAQRRQFSAAQVADASPRHRSSSRCSRYASMRMPISDQRAGCGSSITAQRSAQRGSSRTGMHAHESPSISSHLSGVGACAAAGQGGWEVLRAVHQTPCCRS